MVKYIARIEDDEAGAIIGKGGEKIREIRELTKASITVKTRLEKGKETRILQMEGAERNVQFGRHLIKIRLKLHSVALEEGDDSKKQCDVGELQEIQTAATVSAKFSDI